MIDRRLHEDELQSVEAMNKDEHTSVGQVRVTLVDDTSNLGQVRNVHQVSGVSVRKDLS